MAGFKCYGEFNFSTETIRTMKELFKNHVIYDPNIYSYLLNKKIIHKDFCPICGDNLGADFGHFTLFGRGFYMCAECYNEEAPKSRQIEVNNKTKEGCFIATACYGDYNHPDVLILRNFRDDILLTNLLGKLFIKHYYNISPSIANKLKKRQLLSTLIKHVLIYPVLYILKAFNKKKSSKSL